MALTRDQALSLTQLAAQYNVELAALVAIINVESDGQIFARVDNENVPVIRWEGHYFYRLLKEPKRTAAVKAKLAASTAGGIPNPKAQSARYAMLERAADIDVKAAYSSMSMGVGQVMGEHAEVLGFKNAQEMFMTAKSGLPGQVLLMLRFIEHFGLLDALKRRDWSAFARGYNGKNFRKNAYDTKMADAYRAALNLLGRNPRDITANATGMLRLGSSGAEVREVQALLNRALDGHIEVDGDFGPTTAAAAKQFQANSGLEADGVVGPQTRKALAGYRQANEKAIAAVKVVDLPEIPVATGTTTGGVTVTVAANTLNEVAGKISGSSSFLDHVANGMYVAGAVLMVAGVLWGVYGYVKSRRTIEGTVR